MLQFELTHKHCHVHTPTWPVRQDKHCYLISFFLNIWTCPSAHLPAFIFWDIFMLKRLTVVSEFNILRHIFRTVCGSKLIGKWQMILILWCFHRGGDDWTSITDSPASSSINDDWLGVKWEADLVGWVWFSRRVCVDPHSHYFSSGKCSSTQLIRLVHFECGEVVEW